MAKIRIKKTRKHLYYPDNFPDEMYYNCDLKEGQVLKAKKLNNCEKGEIEDYAISKGKGH